MFTMRHDILRFAREVNDGTLAIMAARASTVKDRVRHAATTGKKP
jgi:hypothetical protein